MLFLYINSLSHYFLITGRVPVMARTYIQHIVVAPGANHIKTAHRVSNSAGECIAGTFSLKLDNPRRSYNPGHEPTPAPDALKVPETFI
jgi:hypothetical protein